MGSADYLGNRFLGMPPTPGFTPRRGPSVRWGNQAAAPNPFSPGGGGSSDAPSQQFQNVEDLSSPQPSSPQMPSIQAGATSFTAPGATSFTAPPNMWNTLYDASRDRQASSFPGDAPDTKAYASAPAPVRSPQDVATPQPAAPQPTPAPARPPNPFAGMPGAENFMQVNANPNGSGFNPNGAQHPGGIPPAFAPTSAQTAANPAQYAGTSFDPAKQINWSAYGAPWAQKQNSGDPSLPAQYGGSMSAADQAAFRTTAPSKNYTDVPGFSPNNYDDSAARALEQKLGPNYTSGNYGGAGLNDYSGQKNPGGVNWSGGPPAGSTPTNDPRLWITPSGATWQAEGAQFTGDELSAAYGNKWVNGVNVGPGIRR